MSVSTPQYMYPPQNGDSGALYQSYVAFMQANIPGWKPYSGELDDWMPRSFAGMQASLTELASDVQTTIYRWFGANIIGLPPHDAVSATALITIDVQDALGYDIPAYTQMSFPDSSGNLQGFETTLDITVPSGQTSATGVFVQAMTPGLAGNGCTGAGDLDNATPITYITGLTMTTTSSSGLDAESDSDYLSRLTAFMTTFSGSPVTPADFTTVTLQQSGVGRAITIAALNPTNTFNLNCVTASGSNEITTASGSTTISLLVGMTVTGTDVPAGSIVTEVLDSTHFFINQNCTGSATNLMAIGGGIASQAGWVATYALDASGNSLSGGVTTAVQNAIDPLLLYGVSFACEAPTRTTINVTVTGTCWPGTTVATVQSAVQAAITSFLQPYNWGNISNPVLGSGQNSGWTNENFVRVSDLYNVIMNIPGMHDISALTINGGTANLILQGVVPVTVPGTISVTLTNG